MVWLLRSGDVGHQLSRSFAIYHLCPRYGRHCFLFKAPYMLIEQCLVARLKIVPLNVTIFFGKFHCLVPCFSICFFRIDLIASTLAPLLIAPGQQQLIKLAFRFRVFMVNTG